MVKNMKNMKIMLCLIGLATLVLTSGCQVRAGYGGGYRSEGEYPHRYYGHEGDDYHHEDRDRDWDEHRR